eukprot:XP_780603.2 PREDICTED: E3 ubiquitin-protein ligase RBBP6 [Strongylocentrotus purpuratus]
MVFFTCNACGQAIKKAQVEKHYQQRCRSCEVLSCMDCGKDFYGDEYKLHTQCISEDQKYGGKGYQAPQNSNKGEAKQEQWLLRVREAVGAGNISSNIKNLLEQIAEYPNVPRKKSKFENFVRNSLKVHHPKTIEQVWDVFSAATAKPDASKSTQPVPKETSEAQGTVSPNSVPDGGVQEKEMEEKAEEMKGKDKRLSKHSETSKSGQKNNMKNAKAGQKREKDKGASKHSEIRESILAVASESSEAETIKKTKEKKKKKSKASEAENPANEKVSAGVKVKAKKKKKSNDRNDSKPAENVESDQASSSKEKVGVKQSKKNKKKKKDSKSDKLLSYSDGEVSFELKLPAKKKISKKADQPKSVAKATKSVVNTANGLEEGAAKKSKKKKKKKKEKIKSVKNKGLLTPSEVKRKAKSVEQKQAATGDSKHSEKKEDEGFESTGNKKSKKLKRKRDKDIDTVIVNKKVKLDVIDETKKAGTSKDKKKKKQNLGVGEKLKSSVGSIEIFPLSNGHLVNTDKKTAKKKKLGKQLSSFKMKDSRSSKGRNKPDEKHTTPVKRKKKKEKKLSSKHMSPCKIDTSTSSDEFGKDLKVKTKKKAGKHKKNIESKNRETNVKKAHSKKKKKAGYGGVGSSDNAGEIRTLSSPKKKRKADVSQNAASNHSNNLDKPASKDSANGKTKKKKVLPPDKKLKGDKKKSKRPLGVIFPCSPGSNITSFELIGNQLVVHVKKVRTHGQTNIQLGDQKVLQGSSAEPLPQKVTKTSSHLDSTPKKVKKKQSNRDGDLGQWGETNIDGKEVKKKKRKHEETNGQPGDQNGTSSTEPPSPKKAKKTSKEKRKKTSTEIPEETATEKVEETSMESSTKEVKKKKKKQEISGDGDQESSDVKKKKKRKHKETNGQLADVSGNSLAETSPKRVKKNPIESSPEKAKKKKKKKQSSGDGDQVASSEMNGSEKAGKKTKSERKEHASSNKTKVANGLTSLPSVPSDDSATSKKKKKSKESTLISDSSKPDALSIDGSKKTKKKTKKEKRDSGSEKGSPVKTGTKLKKQGVVVKSMEEENGLGTTEVKKSKKGSKKSKDPNNNPLSFSTISPSNKSIKTKSKSEKSPEKKKKSHKKDKSKESSDKSGIAEAKNEIKKVRKSKKVKIK